jgi:hypothetical protein
MRGGRRVQTGRAGGLVASCFLALGVAACGGHTVTKKEVIARANGICITALHAMREVPPPTGTADVSPYLAKVLPIVEKEARDTRALPRPTRDRALLDRYVAAVTATATQYRALAKAAANADGAAVAQGLAALRANPAPALAARYGLSRCNASAGTGVS